MSDGGEVLALGSEAPSPWFVRSAEHPVRDGNLITAYIDGDTYFADLAAAIRAASGPSAFVELVDWDLQVDFELVPGDPASTLAELLTAASARDVSIRALVNLHQANPFGAGTVTGYDNTAAASFINSLPTGAAIHDDRYLYAGTHHQKIAVVGSAESLVAYSGGMDINSDRFREGPGRQRHDVQIRVEGPAAWDHHAIVADRWSDHPASAALPPLPQPPLVPEARGDLWAQVVRTVGNGTRRTGVVAGGGRPPGLTFAPRGDRSLAKLVLHGIESARDVIYLEDQYLVNMDVSAALATALPRLQKLVILIPGTAAVNRQLIQGWRRRKEFLTPLLETAPDKVAVCEGTRFYVHSKVWVFDDQLAVVGSANCNRRGYTHDSEQAVAIVGREPEPEVFVGRDGYVGAGTGAQARMGWVHDFRSRLWAKHLGLPIEAVTDPIAAAGHWADPPQSADVAVYDPDGGSDDPPFPRGTDFFWDSIVDPDGS